MKLGFVSDAHGNPFGLQVCIDGLRMRGAGQIFFLGDAIGYFPLAEEVLAILEHEKLPCLLGNHDAMLCGTLPLDPVKDRIYGINDVAQRLDPATKAEISRWPVRRVIECDGLRVLLVHGSPRDELNEYIYPDTDITWFASVKADAVFMGHTHIPFTQKLNDVLVVNVGSCGLPRDIGNSAACALFDTQSGNAEILRIPFDTGQLLAAARRRGKVADQVVRCLSRTRLKTYEGEPHQ